MNRQSPSSGALGAAITRSSSKQTYYTIRLFADPDRRADAYRAYGYFRWADDLIDAPSASSAARTAFAARQQALLEACCRGQAPEGLCAEERMLADLVQDDPEPGSGLQLYLRNMMDVMVFDAGRRGRLISQAELSGYTRKLAVAVTEAIYYFIGHDDPAPRCEARYLAVTAAHITHMLRDAWEDVESGYYNVPREVLDAQGFSPNDLDAPAYHDWVRARVELARRYFDAGRKCTSQVRNLRCRLAGCAYTARFEWMLGAIERDGWRLRREYPERKSLRAALWMAWSAFRDLIAPREAGLPRELAAQPVPIGKR